MKRKKRSEVKRGLRRERTNVGLTFQMEQRMRSTFRNVFNGVVLQILYQPGGFLFKEMVGQAMLIFPSINWRVNQVIQLMK